MVIRFFQLIKTLIKDTVKSMRKDPLNDLQYDRYEPMVLGNKLRNENYHDL